MSLIRFTAVLGAALLCGCTSPRPPTGFTTDGGGASHPGHHRFGAIRYGAASPAPIQAPVEIDCIQSSSTPCSSASHIGSGDQGVPGWLAFGELNDWGLQLGLFTNQPANEVEATPNGAAGLPGPRALVGPDIPPINLALTTGNGGVTGILGVPNGGTGTATPGLVAGTNVTITGTWPNQTVNASGGSGSGTVNSGTTNQVGCYTASGTTISGCTTLPTAAMPALAGDLTGTNGSLAVTVSKVNGAAVPASAALLATNGSSQPITVTAYPTAVPLTGYATASLPTCGSSQKGEMAYTTDGTPAFTFCNGTSWVNNGGTTFTMAGTGCTPTAATGDSTGGSFTLAAGPCTAVTVTFNGAVGMTAPHMWVCAVSDQTLQAAGTWFGEWGQSSSTTTTAVIPIPPAAGATDVITFNCTPH